MGWTKLGNLFIIVKIQSFVNPVDSETDILNILNPV